METGATFLIDFFKEKWEDIFEMESYKWKAVSTFQANLERIFDSSENLHVALRAAFKDTKNLLYFSQLDSLLQNAQFAPAKVRAALASLFDENEDLAIRVKRYREDFKRITEENDQVGCFCGRKKSASQDDRTISVYLTLRYPGRYYIYMKSIYTESWYQVGFDQGPVNVQGGDIVNLRNFFRMCNDVKATLSHDYDLRQMFEKDLKRNNVADFSNGNLLVQTFLYSICRHRNTTQPRFIVHEISREQLQPIAPPKPKFYEAGEGRDYAKERKQNEALGRVGEEYVVDYENQRLSKLCLGGNKNKCIHKAKLPGGDMCGYDILSYNDDGSERYIEVKTTKSSFSTKFYLSHREMEFSKQKAQNYYLYRVYNYDVKNRTGEIAIIQGSLEEYAEYPTEYCVTLSKS